MASKFTMMGIEELRRRYGADYYFIVGGNYGERTSCGGMSEAEVVTEYEDRGVWRCSRWCNSRRKPRAAYIIVCVPSPCGRSCYRGWIDEKRYRWDGGPLSLRVARL
jgi:hypothetical protein